MKNYTATIGIDDSKEWLNFSVITGSRDIEKENGRIPNTPEAIKKFAKRQLVAHKTVCCCYEAGVNGFQLYRQFEKQGMKCTVAAPTLTPRKTGNRVKNDRRDAKELALLHRYGQLTAVRVPGEKQEGIRDIMRLRETVSDRLRQVQNQVRHMALRHGHPWHGKSGTQKYWKWARSLKFTSSEAQWTFQYYLGLMETEEKHLEELDMMVVQVAQEKESVEGVRKLSLLKGFSTQQSMAFLAEMGDLRRFNHPGKLMAYNGLVVAEDSTGGKRKGLGITKTGSRRGRTALVKAAWTMVTTPYNNEAIRKRRENGKDSEIEIALKAQRRLYKRFHYLVARGKSRQKAIVAVARELCGFIWDLFNQPVVSAAR
jgi:transposase